MAVKAVQVTVPSDGSVVSINDADGDPLFGDELGIRNTGTVTVLLGGADNVVFPLAVNEFYGTSVAPGDVFSVKVQTNGTAGQVTAIKAK